jgi:hypothetical protein
MKVAGFTFIRNAVKLDFPVVEAITSVLPLCDEFFIAVGKSEDQTLQLIRNISSSKINITETNWNFDLTRGGEVYADETNKAFDFIPAEFDWCFYIQADEVLHEKYHEAVRTAMQKRLDYPSVDGLLFRFLHFYGTFDYVGDCRHWYRNEVRIIRNDKTIRSYRDAQGFRKNGKKLNVERIDAEIYHYGWIRDPQKMQVKIDEVKKYYQRVTDTAIQETTGKEIFDYGRQYDALARFNGTHPAAMQERIKRLNWNVEVDLKKINMRLKYRTLYNIEKWFGVRLFEYRNYKVI